jgi:beta-phosphoglucomutase
MNSLADKNDRAVLWDLDGTVVDSEEFHWRAWQVTMAAQGVAITHGQFLATFGQRNDSVLPGWLGVPPGDPLVERIGAAKESLYRRMVESEGLSPLPGVREWVERLHREGWRQAIASSAPGRNVDVVLRTIGLASDFQAIVAAEDVTTGKPDPQVFLLAARRVGVEPPRCTVVEDAAAGVEAGKRAGMRTIAVGRNATRLGADIAVASLADLPPHAFGGK